MSYLEQRQSHTHRSIHTTQLKVVVVKLHTKDTTEYNNLLWPEIVVENWTGSSGHERHLPTGVGILSWELKARAYQLETTMHIQCASLAVHNITVTMVNFGEILPKIQTEFLFKITGKVWFSNLGSTKLESNDQKDFKFQIIILFHVVPSSFRIPKITAHFLGENWPTTAIVSRCADCSGFSKPRLCF